MANNYWSHEDKARVWFAWKQFGKGKMPGKTTEWIQDLAATMNHSASSIAMLVGNIVAACDDAPQIGLRSGARSTRLLVYGFLMIEACQDLLACKPFAAGRIHALAVKLGGRENLGGWPGLASSYCKKFGMKYESS